MMNLFELPLHQKVQSKTPLGVLAPLLFLLLLVPGAQAQAFQTADRAGLVFSLSSRLTIIPQSTSYNLEHVTASLYLYPKPDWRQDVPDIQTTPPSREENSTRVFEWEKPGLSLPFSLESSVTTRNDIQKIRDRVPFPPTVPPELLDYTLPSQAIDAGHPSITALANSLAEGETDLYTVAHMFGAWVNENIEYDLACEKDVEKASWVLRNKRGVCDEFSSLFIALCRAVGIPARYVAGMAYSNIPGRDGFGPHGWAEAYFPGTGWVPFDPTFGQLGWIDASHIKLAEQPDSNESSVLYKWTGRDVSIETRPLQMSAGVASTSGTAPIHLSFTISPFHSETGFGSYNIIQAVAENPKDYYVPTQLVFSRTENLEMLGPSHEHLLLKPGETRTVYRIARVSPDLRPGFIYTFPISFENMRNTSALSQIKAERRYPVHTLEDMQDYISLMEEEETKAYSRELVFSCSPESPEIHTREQTTVTCTLHNRGNTPLADLEACLASDCTDLDIPIGQHRDTSFTVTAPETEGTLNLLASARNQDVSKTARVIITVLMQPDILSQIMEAINSFLGWLAGLFPWNQI